MTDHKDEKADVAEISVQIPLWMLEFIEEKAKHLQIDRANVVTFLLDSGMRALGIDAPSKVRR